MHPVAVIVILIALVSLALWNKESLMGTQAPAPEQVTQVAPNTHEQPLSNSIVVDMPQQDAKVGKTFTVSGKAPGPWFSEASFPIMIADAQNNKIATVIAQAQGEWMTTDLVPFTATVNVGNYSGIASVTLVRDNPSGLPENDDSYSIVVNVQ